MRIVATTSLPAVDRPNANRWNAARSYQKRMASVLLLNRWTKNVSSSLRSFHICYYLSRHILYIYPASFIYIGKAGTSSLSRRAIPRRYSPCLKDRDIHGICEKDLDYPVSDPSDCSNWKHQERRADNKFLI